jgi:hypothetical protein
MKVGSALAAKTVTESHPDAQSDNHEAAKAAGGNCQNSVDTNGFGKQSQKRIRGWQLMSPTPEKVEAAGIEPASRNSSTKASTCVVELFNLAVALPCRPGRTAASPELF